MRDSGACRVDQVVTIEAHRIAGLQTGAASTADGHDGVAFLEFTDDSIDRDQPGEKPKDQRRLIVSQGRPAPPRIRRRQMASRLGLDA
jgi:hypothetical protein